MGRQRVKLIDIRMVEEPDDEPYERVPYIGIRAVAKINIDIGEGGMQFWVTQTIESPGIWQVEYDEDDAYKEELFLDEKEILLEMLNVLGVRR
jgi:hypothetical protein